jgi:TolB protein
MTVRGESSFVGHHDETLSLLRIGVAFFFTAPAFAQPLRELSPDDQRIVSEAMQLNQNVRKLRREFEEIQLNLQTVQNAKPKNEEDRLELERMQADLNSKIPKLSAALADLEKKLQEIKEQNQRLASYMPVPLSTLEFKYLKNVRQVTKIVAEGGFTKAGEGYFSPDGTEIVYQAVPKNYMFYQIFRQPLAPVDGKAGEPKLISTGRGRTTCSFFTRDAQGILFASSHKDPQLDATEAAEKKQLAEDAASGKRRRYSWDFDPWTDIFVGDRDGKNLKQLTTEKGYDAEGAYSPDGKQIAFCSDRDGDPDLYVMDADGKNVRQLTNEPGYDGGPFISPNGRWVVYRTDRKKAELLQIHVIGLDGKNDTALTDNVGVNWAPYWHPTKPYIIWTGADHSNPMARPNYDLWLMKYDEQDGRIAPGPITRITDNASADVLPVFSPDGSKLMWTSTRTPDRSSQLFLADFVLPD